MSSTEGVGDSMGNLKRNSRVAVIDDDPEIQALLLELFRAEQYEVSAISTGEDFLNAARKAQSDTWDLVICDLMLPELNGIELIESLNHLNLDFPVILITANATVETAAEALKKGAFDYITKPIQFLELSIVSKRAIQLRRMEREYHALRKKVLRASSLESMVGKSARMQTVFSLIERVSKSAANVLVTGESGTGKEMVARAIHAKSNRSDQRMVAINCTAIPDTLLESELFGHKKGAFTGAHADHRGLFEEAHGGTLFLDEIGDMPLSLQAKLLRVLQERKVKPVGDNQLRSIDVRIIAATHQDLKKRVQEGKFREDLFYRLCVFPIEVPPLRERKEDIPFLSEHFIQKFCQANQVPEKALSKPALSKLLRLRWSGNVRELENTIERAVLLADGDVIDEDHIQCEGSAADLDRRFDQLFSGLPTLSQLEKEYIQYVLAETSGKKETASEILGINRKTLYRKERDYGLEE